MGNAEQFQLFDVKTIPVITDLSATKYFFPRCSNQLPNFLSWSKSQPSVYKIVEMQNGKAEVGSVKSTVTILI